MGATTHERPDSLSGLDRFFAWVERLPVSWWGFYCGLAALLIGVEVAVMGSGATGRLAPFPVVQVAVLPAGLCLIHGLNRLAHRSFARFRPLINASDSEVHALRHKLVTLPPRPTRRAMLTGAILGAAILGVIPARFLADELGYSLTVPSVIYNVIINAFVWAVASAWVYHTYHQLSVAHRITLHARSVNLFALNSIYAFSALSAATALSNMGITVALYAVSPRLLSQFVPVAILVFFTSLSFLAFVLPLRGARALLVAEKSKRLRETGDRMAMLYGELHRRVDSGEIANMDELNLALTSLDMERTALNRVSALPWPRDLFRVVALALLSPILWWAADRILTALAGS